MTLYEALSLFLTTIMTLLLVLEHF